MAASPQYAATPVVGQSSNTVANPNRNGTGTIVDVLTGGPNGTRIDRVCIQSLVTTTAGLFRLYITAPAQTARLLIEIPMSANTVSATNPGFHQEVGLFGGMFLPTGWKLQSSIEKAESTICQAFGGDF